MPPRTKRNAPSRRHQPPVQSAYPDAQLPGHDLLSFDSDVPSHSTYSTMTPAVFDLEQPPSDPEAGRASAAIHVDYAKEMYGPGVPDSDIDDGGPVSPSTSPPGPSSYGTGNFTIADVPSSSSPGHPALRNLAVADDTTSDESSLARSVGHVRSPVLAR